MFRLHLCLCTIGMSSASVPDETSAPLELELKMIVSHHLGAGIQTQVPDGEVLFWNIWAGQKKKKKTTLPQHLTRP